MKAIIDGKRYNTETAEELAKWWNGCSYSDFDHCSEKLYRTKSGALFLAGEGGALSSYAESCEGGRTCTGGERIIPMTQDEAVTWLEQHGKTYEIEQHFPQAVQDA
jgi:hypothetical protein